MDYRTDNEITTKICDLPSAYDPLPSVSDGSTDSFRVSGILTGSFPFELKQCSRSQEHRRKVSEYSTTFYFQTS